MNQFMFRAGGIALALSLLLPAGCDQLKKSSEADSDPAATTAGTAGAGTAAKSACDQVADQFCKKGSEKSANCQAFKSLAKVLAPQTCETQLKHADFTVGKLKDQRKLCDELVSKLCKELGPETQTCKMVTDQTDKFQPEQCEKMMGQYDTILADLKKREAKNKPLSDELKTAIAAPDAPSFGPGDAKVTIVEFSDFQCPYCSRAADVATQVKKKYGDKVRFVFRQFPLSFHKEAHVAAQAALASHEQGKFWQFHDELFKNQRALKRPELEGYAKKLGLNLGKFKAALDAEKYKAQVDADLALGGKVAVSGTPTMFLNGERVQNPTDFASISKLIDGKLGS